MPGETAWGNVDEPVIGKWRSVLAINDPLNLPDSYPLRDALPGIRTIGELRELVRAWNERLADQGSDAT